MCKIPGMFKYLLDILYSFCESSKAVLASSSKYCQSYRKRAKMSTVRENNHINPTLYNPVPITQQL